MDANIRKIMKTAIKELQDGLANTQWGTFLLYSYDTQTSPTRKNHQTETFFTTAHAQRNIRVDSRNNHHVWG